MLARGVRRWASGFCSEALCLLVRRGSVRDEIDLANMEKVTTSAYRNPPRLTLHLKQDSKLGRRIHFVPLRNASWHTPLEQWPVVVSLRARIERRSLVAPTAPREGRRDP